VRPVEIARRHSLQDDRKAQKAVHDGVVVDASDQSLRTAEPPHGGPDLTRDREVHPEQHCGLRRGLRAAVVYVEPMDALQRRPVFADTTDERCGLGEKLEISGPERRALVGAGQRFERVAPSGTRVRAAAAFELVRRVVRHTCIFATAGARGRTSRSPTTASLAFTSPPSQPVRLAPRPQRD